MLRAARRRGDVAREEAEPQALSERSISSGNYQMIAAEAAESPRNGARAAQAPQGRSRPSSEFQIAVSARLC